MSTIVLYGHLREKLGKTYSLDVQSAAEAIRAMSAVVPGFKEAILGNGETPLAYKVLIGDKVASIHEYQNPTSTSTIRIVPAIMGSKSKTEQILTGALLMWAGSGLGGPIVPGGDGLSMMQAAGSMMSNFGMSMVMSGIAQMLAPDPVDTPETPKNYYFNGPVNTTKQGTPVPVAYGQVLVGGAVISAQIVSQDKTRLD